MAPAEIGFRRDAHGFARWPPEANCDSIESRLCTMSVPAETWAAFMSGPKIERDKERKRETKERSETYWKIKYFYIFIHNYLIFLLYIYQWNKYRLIFRTLPKIREAMSFFFLIWLRLFCSYYKMWTSRQTRRLGCTVTASLKYVAQPYKTKVGPWGQCMYNPDVVVSFVGVQEYHLTSCQNPLGGWHERCKKQVFAIEIVYFSKK